MISEDIPLNQGCLKPIDVRIPKNSFLSPSGKAAVVGGNVLTVGSKFSPCAFIVNM
jgi:5-oxoprolinase (ATP-hydrolysing)